ncbi:MAG: peptidase S41, partial [Acidobacteriota bacterium]
MHKLARSIVLGGFILLVVGAADAQIDAQLLRQPDVSSTDIAFVYGGDIWVVSKQGGIAQRLSTPKGEESFPRFSPDGEHIAFSGNYDGNQDIFVMPTGGGLPARLTHHPDPDRMIDWYPDGTGILFATPMTSEKQRF